MGKYLNEAQGGKDSTVVLLEAEQELQAIMQDIETSLMYAFRYALGRSSYCVGDMCVMISKHKGTLHGNTLSTIKKEIQEYLESAPHGFTREWQDLLRELNNDPKGYSMSTLELRKTTVKCTYKGNGFVCYNGYDVEDDRIVCPKCGGTGYDEKGDE